jgi:glycine/D-amino acid oxidase-like deaminating enzyme
MATPRVAVVGAGILGAAIAYQLARRGAEVTVIEAGQPGQQASRASFAWINGRDKNPREYHDLNRRSLDMWPRFARGLGEVGLVWGGELRWATSRTGAEAIESRVALLHSWGYPIRLMDEEGMGVLEPDLRLGDFQVGSFSEADMQVDPPRVVERCLERAGDQSATVRTECEVTGFQTSGSAVTHLDTSDGRVECDVVVLAAGASAPELAKAAGARAPVYDTFGATVVTTSIKPLFHTVAVVHSPRDHEVPLNVCQHEDGRVVIHGGRHGDMHDESYGKNDDEAQEILQRACQYFPHLDNASVSELRQARRPIPNDGQSIIGFSPKATNLYLVATHSGVTLAPVISESAAIEIMDDVEIQALSPFRPSRFK